VNISLTLRNWAIGCHIREYEQNGADRAEYGENLLDRLAERLDAEGTPTTPDSDSSPNGQRSVAKPVTAGPGSL